MPLRSAAHLSLASTRPGKGNVYFVGSTILWTWPDVDLASNDWNPARVIIYLSSNTNIATKSMFNCTFQANTIEVLGYAKNGIRVWSNVIGGLKGNVSIVGNAVRGQIGSLSSFVQGVFGIEELMVASNNPSGKQKPTEFGSRTAASFALSPITPSMS